MTGGWGKGSNTGEGWLRTGGKTILMQGTLGAFLCPFWASLESPDTPRPHPFPWTNLSSPLHFSDLL